MNISSVAGSYAQQAYNSQVSSKRPIKGSVVDSGAKSKPTQPKDSVELSSASKDKLKNIQSKISTGFYNRNEVTEDITDKLTRYFDEATD
ncbi:MAG: hypothetical protein OCC49_05085 [Fibrobacterales bacterium]